MNKITAKFQVSSFKNCRRIFKTSEYVFMVQVQWVPWIGGLGTSCLRWPGCLHQDFLEIDFLAVPDREE